VSFGARVRKAVSLVAPFGLHVVLGRRESRRRTRLIERVAGNVDGRRAQDYSPGEARRFLLARGLDDEQVRTGSMPEASLEFTGNLLREHLPSDRPLVALHVGNFVGFSLSYFTWLLREQHPDSVVVSIDPNIRHRGVENPQGHVMAVLGRFGLLANSVVVPGYTLEQNFGDDWSDDLEQRYLAEAACDQVLANLARMSAGAFDLAVLDGNHDGDYLERELTAVRRLLRDDSIVVFDDIGPYWPGVAEVFERTLADSGGGFAELGQDGRVGILQLRAG
jgi:hypothetical protein